MSGLDGWMSQATCRKRPSAFFGVPALRTARLCTCTAWYLGRLRATSNCPLGSEISFSKYSTPNVTQHHQFCISELEVSSVGTLHCSRYFLFLTHVLHESVVLSISKSPASTGHPPMSRRLVYPQYEAAQGRRPIWALPGLGWLPSILHGHELPEAGPHGLETRRRPAPIPKS